MMKPEQSPLHSTLVLSVLLRATGRRETAAMSASTRTDHTEMWPVAVVSW